MRVLLRHAWTLVLALFVVCMAHREGAADVWPNPVIAVETRLGLPSEGFSFHASGPALSIGTAALQTDFEAAARHANGEWNPVRPWGGVKVSKPFRSGVGWFGMAMIPQPGPDRRSIVPLFEAGGLTRFRGVALGGRARHWTAWVPQPSLLVTSWTSPPDFHSPPDIIPTVPYWEPRKAESTDLTSLEAIGLWKRSRWDVDASGGLAIGTRNAPIPLARLQATRWLRPGLGVMLGATAGVPQWLFEARQDCSRFQLGLRVEPGRNLAGLTSRRGEGSADSGWNVVRLREGLYGFRVRAAGIERVSLRGDFTGWEAVPLRRVGFGWWEVTLPLSPGLHQWEVSVNGAEWQPPAGLPSTAGVYGGEVGTLVAK